MKKGSKKCKLCDEFTSEPKTIPVYRKGVVFICHHCWCFLMAKLVNENKSGTER